MSRYLTKNKIEYPDFEEIIKRCKKKIQEQFPKYGNGWKDESFTLDWWQKRIQGELDEIFKTKTLGEMLPEMIDLIIVTSMLYDRMALVKCSKCGKHLMQFNILDGEPVCKKCYWGD